MIWGSESQSSTSQDYGWRNRKWKTDHYTHHMLDLQQGFYCSVLYQEAKPILSVAMLNESIICSHKERERKKNMIENKYIILFRF